MTPVESPPSASPSSKGGALRSELASLKIDRTRRRRTNPLVALAWALLLLGAAAALGGAGYWAFKDKLFPLPVVKADSARVMSLGQARTELTATGYLESRWQAAVGAKVPGRIANIPVEEGDRVSAGDVLAELEHADLDAALASRKVQVALAEAQLEEAETNLAQAERDMEREKDVFARKASTRAAFEKVETTYNAALAVREARRAAVDAARAAVVEAEQAVRNMFIYAPFDGTVVTKDAEQGESIMPGGMGASSGRGSVITLAKLDELEVDTDVKEDYLGQLHQGQPCEVAVDAAPDKRYRGRLREIIPMGDRTRGIVKVKVSILDPDERLFPELSATVNFLPEAKAGESAEAVQEKGVFAPVACLQGAGAELFVWKLERDRVKRVAVTVTGQPNDDGLQQVSSGLAGGERLVVDPPQDLKEGNQVRLAE